MQVSAVQPAASAGRPLKSSVAVPRDLSVQQRWALAVSVLVAHGVAGWLMSRSRLVEVSAERAPITVQLIAPVQAPPVVTPVPPAPAPPQKVAPPKPVLSTRAPSKNVLQAPPEPVKQPAVEAPPVPTPPAPAVTAAVAAPMASAPAAPVPAPAEPQAPKQLSISSVRYAVPPTIVYPETSKRLGESGVVTLSVTVDERGRASDVRVSRSSGFSRLDQAAVTAMKAARFVPYMEGGVPRAFTVPAPINYDLSD